jgi:7-cyano-7-deazaguanine synthase
MKVHPASDVLILLSGGLDSTACISFFQRQALSVRAMFVDYGQLSASRERHAARAIAAFYEVPLLEVRCGGSSKPSGCVQGRNAFLLLLALVETQMKSGLLSIGIHSGTAYWDCQPEFATTMQTLLEGYSNGRVRLNLPFIKWTKRDIWDFCHSANVPVELTYSCELGRDQPCNDCVSCDDRKRLLAG